uniref:kelch-like protein 26 isoform X1 n=1 Tax=Styela clava TaxID=7725 RepID=UPI001939978C|nr:kelch-like protein 26 isoform X1 [Styela clava]
MGLVIYAVWSDGKHPFGEDPDGWNMYIKKNQNLRDLSHLHLSDKTRANNFLEKMLQFEPEKRPTADELLDEELFRRSVKSNSDISPDVILENMCHEYDNMEYEGLTATGWIQGLKPSESIQDLPNRTTEKGSNENEIILSRDGKFFFYKPATKKWRQWKEINQLSINLYSIVTMNDYLYVLGENGDVYRTKYADSEPKWEILSNMICVHGYFPSSVTMNGYIYVCGGRTSTTHSRPVGSVERYDPTINEWQELESMNVGRKDPAVVAFGGRLYCFGGKDENGDCLKSGEVLEPGCSKWKWTSPMLLEMKSSLYAAKANDSISYIVGGQVLQCYDANNNTWQETSLKNQLSVSSWHFERIISLDNEIYFIIYAQGIHSLYKFDRNTNHVEPVETDERFWANSVAVGQR